jgi:LmbE family N-acetylglucosaminyl deacetylase
MNPFEKPELMDAKRVLAIQPHYDDNDIAAGGTIATLAENGTQIYYLTVTNDIVGVIDTALSDEAAQIQLRSEQEQAGEIIGVKEHYWLNYPDAGQYDYFELRKQIIMHIRVIKPDFIITCDPWNPYEAHNDHIQSGQAAILFGLPRISTSPQIDEDFNQKPSDLTGVAFYATSNPNTIFDISNTKVKKHAAIEKYTAQFNENDLRMLLLFLEHKEQECARDKPFSHGEPLKVLRGFHLHGYPDAITT